jgi:hypothetical protein
MKCLSVYDNCLWGIGGYLGESKRRNEILAYFKSNVDSSAENGGCKIHERRVCVCVCMYVCVCVYQITEFLTKTKRIGSASV